MSNPMYQNQNPFANPNPFANIQQQYDNLQKNILNMQNYAQQMASMFQNPANNQNPQPEQPAANQNQNVPPHIQQITILGEIKSLLVSNNELMQKFISGTPIEDKKVVDNQFNKKKDEGDKK